MSSIINALNDGLVAMGIIATTKQLQSGHIHITAINVVGDKAVLVKLNYRTMINGQEIEPDSHFCLTFFDMNQTCSVYKESFYEIANPIAFDKLIADIKQYLL